MRVTLEKLMESLGVGRVLMPYETQPWFHYDEGKKLTCSAEVRMGPGGDDVEAEIQFLKEESDEDDGTGDEETGGLPPGIPEQILRMRAEPVNDHEWSPKELRVKGEDYKNKFHGWEEKGCKFFFACISAINAGEIPDIDELIKKELSDDSFGGGRKGRVGRKAPKVKPAQLMGMNKRGM